MRLTLVFICISAIERYTWFKKKYSFSLFLSNVNLKLLSVVVVVVYYQLRGNIASAVWVASRNSIRSDS